MREIAQVIPGAIRQNMSAWSAAALVGLSVAGIARAEGKSDNPASAVAHSPVALIDIKYVLEQHAALQRRKEELEAGAALAAATVQQRKREIEQLAERLKHLEAGLPEHTELDLEIIRQSAELKAQIDRAREKFVRESTRAHAEAYQEIVRAVKGYLDETDFRIVLRTNAADVEPTKAPSRDGPAFYQKKLIHRTVVFSQPGVDITHEIVRQLNEDRRKTAGRMRKQSRR